MKKFIQTVVAVVVTANMTGCATPFMTDRCRDAADVFTATVGWGGGVKARLGPLRAGVFAGCDVLGLRGGQTIKDMRPSRRDYVYGATEVDLTLFSLEFFVPSQTSNTVARQKQFASLGMCGLSITDWSHEAAPSYYTQIETAIGLGGTLRLGFNPGELLDFILGWTTIDVFKDDLEAKKQQ